MKPKMHYQVQPPEIVLPSTPDVREQVRDVQEQVQKDRVQKQRVQEEIQSFLRALDSYPARVAEEPGVSFHQHLSSLFAARGDSGRSPKDRRDDRSGRQ
jgi:hypothetical protein